MLRSPALSFMLWLSLFSITVFGQENSSSDSCFTTIGLIQVVNQYGTDIPDVQIAMQNHHQDISGGGSLVGQLSRFNGVSMVNSAGVWQVDSTQFAFEWYINDDLVSEFANPKVNGLDSLVAGGQIPCDGVVRFLQRITTFPSGAVSELEVWAYLDFNYIEDCICDECPLSTEVFYDFYPDDYLPYDHQLLPSPQDLNADQQIDSMDLLMVIASFCF